MLSYDDQIKLLERIASHREPWLDPLFLFLNYLDTPYFPLILIPCVWLFFSSRWAFRLAILFPISWLINTEAKLFFDLPRPIEKIPMIAMIPIHSPGFPSGAAQTSILLGSLLIYAWKTKIAKWIAIPYILLMSFSRLYLGVHYPTDILGGWAIGLLIFFLYLCAERRAEKGHRL